MTLGASSNKPDKVVQECFGYKARSSDSRCCLLVSPVTAALIYTLAGIAPKLAARLLAPCSLQEAECVLLKLLNGRHYLVRVSVHSKSADLSMFSRTLGRNLDADNDQNLHTFKLLWRLYIYSPGQGTFGPVPAMPSHLPRQIRRALETLHLINTAGVEWKTLNAGQKQLRRDVIPLYGTPRALLQIRAGSTIKGHDYRSLFSLQFLEVAYMMYVGRWFLPVLILILFGAATVNLLLTLRRQRLKVMAMMNEHRLTALVWEGWVRAVSSHRLVPGDIIVLRQGKAVCDMVILQGSCLVMESMLSGEAAQVRKSNYVPEKGVDYDPDKHSTCTVFAGTLIQQVWNPQDSDDEVLVMVVRNGLNTTVGNMVREIIAPIKQDVQDDFVKDVFRLYAFAFCLQLLIHIAYFVKAPTLHQTPGFHVKTILDMLMYAAPPGLPLMMVLHGTVGRWRLRRDKMTLNFNEALTDGACADVVAFDKTGTLTHSAAELHGVLPVQSGEFQALQQSALRWPNRLKQAVAVCNGLNMVGKHTVVGVDMERTMFKAVEARFMDRETVVLPRQPDHTSSAALAKLSVIKVMEFTSQTLRSGVVVWSDDGPKGSALLFLRGAPGMIRDMVQPASVPANFNQVTDDYSSKSFRLLAMAVGVIPRAAKLSLVHMTQQQVEAQAINMQLLCLVVLTNNVRTDSKATITQLQEGGGLRTVMITGDYHHTAVAVAKDVGMVKPDSRVVVIDTARYELQHDAQMLGTPDSASSSEPHPRSQATPRVSFEARTADFTHGFFGSAQENCSQLGSPAPREVRRADGSSAEAAKGARKAPGKAQIGQESSQSSLVAGLPVSPNLQPSIMDSPTAKQMSAADDSAFGKKVSFEVARLPLEMSSPGRQPADAPPTVRLAQVKLVPLARHPSKAASESSLLPSKGNVPFERPLPTAHQPSSRLSFEGPPPIRQLSKVSSLTRLPSEAASLLAASPPDSSATSQDDSSFSRQLSSRHKRVQSLSNKLLQASVAKLLTPFQLYSGGSTPVHLRRVSSECGAQNLTFTCGAGRQHVDPCDALTAMAEGTMQCAVTGDAFEMLLQLKEASLLETVMRNAVVFSRMQPHQKGQVMDLLGVQGIQQRNQGHPRHIQGLGNRTIFCGDGINDLPALAAADVGISIGASEAFIAASVSTSQSSVAGVCSFIRIGKGGHAMMMSLFKYMVLYQCIQGRMNCNALFLDGSDLSTLQMTVIEAEAMLIALAACLVPPLVQLNRHKSEDRASRPTTLVLLFVMVAGLEVVDLAIVILMTTQSWYTGGTGSATNNPVATLVFLNGNFQLLAPLISLLLETQPFCQSALKSKPMLLLSLFYLISAYGSIVAPLQSIWNPLGFFDFPQSFRWRHGCAIAVMTVVYAALIRVTRRILACHERRRLRPV